MDTNGNKTPEQIRRVIQGLLAKANNVYSNEEGKGITEALQNEAAQAAIKAAELMQKYNLSMRDVSPEEKKMVEIASEYTLARLDKWRVSLASAIASHMFCKMFFAKGVHPNPFFAAKGQQKMGLRWQLRFYGRKDNAEMAAFLWDQLHNRLVGMVEEVVSDYIETVENHYGVQAFKIGQGSDHPNVYRNSWLFGAVVGIHRKLEEQRRQASNEIKAIILLRDEEVEQAWIGRSQGFAKISSNRPVSVRNDAYQSGYNAGHEMDIHSGLKGD